MNVVASVPRSVQSPAGSALAGPSVMIAMVLPVMAISRAVLVHSMAMVAWPRVDAEHPVHAADGAAGRAADNTANRAGRR